MTTSSLTDRNEKKWSRLKSNNSFLAKKVKVIHSSTRMKGEDCMNDYILHCVQQQEDPVKETNLAITSSSTKSDH